MSKTLAVTDKSVDLSSPSQLVEFAKTLKQFIVDQKLYTQIQNKNYVEVEGWQFAGASMGVMPIVKSVEPLDGAEGEIKYRAEVELIRVATGDRVGYGVATCSNRESKRKTADEYVIASMAQTRATGKAFRNGFAWLMKVAGYEATPAEEMESNPGNPDPTIYDQIKSAKNNQELSKILNSVSPEVKKTITRAVSERMEELKLNQAEASEGGNEPA